MGQEYFSDWGSKENPIRKSDLKRMFGVFGCAKRTYLSATSEREHRRIDSKMGLGIVIHSIIEKDLLYHKRPTVKEEIANYERKQNVRISYTDQQKEIGEAEILLHEFFKSSYYKTVVQKLVDAERSFMVKIGKFWVAGTIDCLVNAKDGGLVLIDWKTGSPESQYELDNGYESRIYCHAVKAGEFFLRPDNVKDGRDYSKAFKKTMQRNTYGEFPTFTHAYLKELIPAERASKKTPKHYSTKKMQLEDGKLVIKKGERRGPIFYQAQVNPRLERLEYTIACAVAMAQSNLFPESFGPNCEDCAYQNACESVGVGVDSRQQVMSLMEDLGIEPD